MPTAVDPTLSEVVSVLFGDAVDPRELIAKMSPTASDVHVNTAAKTDKRKRAITAGLSAIGAAAGTAGLAYGAKDMYEAKRIPTGKHAFKVRGKIKGTTKALVPLEVAGLGGEFMATKILHGDVTAKKKKQFAKAFDDILAARRDGKISTDIALRLSEELEKGLFSPRRPTIAEQIAMNYRHIPRGRRHLVKVAAGAGVVTGAAGMRAYDKHKAKQQSIAKNDEVEYVFTGTIEKADTDKRLVFGWCSLSEVDGQPVVDLQGDYAPIEEIEKSAYKYVVESRKGGDMHQRLGEGPLHTADLVESFVVTKEKLASLGISEEAAKDIPIGWWIGMKVNDDAQWAKVKNGERLGFSIHGAGQRVEKAV